MPDSSLIFSTSLFMCLFPSGKKKIRRWFTLTIPCSFHVKGEVYTPVIPWSPWPTKSTLPWAAMWSQWPILQRPVHYGHEESWRPPPSSKLWLPATIQAKEKRPSPPNLVIFLPRKFADFQAPRRINVSIEFINRMALQLCLLSPLVFTT